MPLNSQALILHEIFNSGSQFLTNFTNTLGQISAKTLVAAQQSLDATLQQRTARVNPLLEAGKYLLMAHGKVSYVDLPKSISLADNKLSFFYKLNHDLQKQMLPNKIATVENQTGLVNPGSAKRM